MFLLSGQKGKDAMHTDSAIGQGYSVVKYRHPLLQKINPYLRSLHGMQDPVAKRRVRWTPHTAALAAILMVLDVGCSLTVRFQDALACLGVDLRGSRLGRSYNGLLKALVRQSSTVLSTLKTDLRCQTRAALDYIPRVQGWTLLAVDGSKEDLPRTRSQEKHFGIADNGKGPQALVTTIVEVLTGLLWDWRVTRGRGSEKAMLIEMVRELPESALLLADGNFVGYPVWSALAKAGKHFLIRVGGNVSLIRKLWPEMPMERHGDLVYVWPTHRQKCVSPLPLRLIKVRGGQDPVFLLTNVLDHRQLKRAAAGKIYRRRWGVELFYRTLKRTLGYAKLRSRSGTRAAVELEWGLIALWIMAMMGIERLRKRRINCWRLSPALLVRTLRTSLLRGAASPSAESGWRKLNAALALVAQFGSKIGPGGSAAVGFGPKSALHFSGVRRRSSTPIG